MRFRPDAGGRARWLALTAADAGPALQGFRAALYARTGAPTVQAGTSADQVLP